MFITFAENAKSFTIFFLSFSFSFLGTFYHPLLSVRKTNIGLISLDKLKKVSVRIVS